MWRIACIITVGSEITRGLIQDTNSHWLASRLSSLGITVKRIISVPDDKSEIAWALKSCLEVSDIILVTGGLGFTADDITLEAAAEALGVKLVFSSEALEMIKSRVKGEVTYQVKAAYIPEGSRPLYNRVGVSPGVHLTLSAKHIFFLPGVPGEMQTIFEDHVKPLLTSTTYFSRTLLVRTKHSTEAEVYKLLEPLKYKYTWAYFKTHAKTPVEVVVVIQANSLIELEERTRKLINDLEKIILIESLEYT
jgi:molybdenum cofactor synthesis domain-containing protein